MEATELQTDSIQLENFPKLPLWIIEHVWAHNMMEIHEVVDFSNWPDVDSQPLRLEDSWRLRFASAQVYCIVKNRDMEHFERVMGFLEATYRLLPRLVAPIKHMKILFGLKTMVIMRMLREGRGMVDTVFKINQFFPNKLPQYQDQCSQHEMFLMRKNYLDFKALAQALTMDKNKLEDYMKNQMEEQYGECYAQKVEDRLLHYLQELESVLPGDTYVDKILKKGSPMTEEEKLLLEVITSDSTSIAATLKKLLHCDVASCHPGRISMKSSQLSKSVLHGSSSKAPLQSMEAKTPLQFQPKVFQGGEDADQDVPKDRTLVLEDDVFSDVGRHQQTEEDIELVTRVEDDSGDMEKEEISQRSGEHVHQAASSPQFCSRHQRWVKSILQECPDECSEELLLQANVSLSPPLFHSSSSTTSSQDLTPSDLIPCPPDQQHPPSQTSTHLQTAAQASEKANPKDEQSCNTPVLASDRSQTKLLQQPSSSRDTQLPVLLSPVVRLIDIASVKRIYPTLNPHQAPQNCFTMSNNKQAASASSPQVLASRHCRTSGNDATPRGTMNDTVFDQVDTVAPTNLPNTTHKVQTVPLSRDAPNSTSCQPPTQKSYSKVSREFRCGGPTTRQSRALGGFSQTVPAEQLVKAPTTVWTTCLPLPNFNVSGLPTKDASTSTFQSGNLYSVCAANQIPLSIESSQHVVPQNSTKPHPQSKTRPCSSVVSSTSNDCLAVRSETSRFSRAQLRLSLPSQAVLLQSKLLQPFVTLNRLSSQECYRATKWRSSPRYVETMLQGGNDDNDEDSTEEEEEDADSSFDLNTLYSSHSCSDSEDSSDCDPEYKPRFKKKRLC